MTSVEQAPKPEKWGKADHYVVFMVDGIPFITDPLPKEIADILNQKLDGIVCPTDINELLGGEVNNNGD